MKNQTDNAHARLKRNSKLLKRLFKILLVCGIGYTMFIIYNGMTDQNLIKFCYAFFAGNAVAANCLFSLGRTNLVIKPDYENLRKDDFQTLINSSGLYFLVAAIIGLFASGIAYVQNNGTLPIFVSTTHTETVFVILSVFLTIGVIFASAATLNFLKFAIPEIVDLIFSEKKDLE